MMRNSYPFHHSRSFLHFCTRSGLSVSPTSTSFWWGKRTHSCRHVKFPKKLHHALITEQLWKPAPVYPVVFASHRWIYILFSALSPFGGGVPQPCVKSLCGKVERRWNAPVCQERTAAGSSASSPDLLSFIYSDIPEQLSLKIKEALMSLPGRTSEPPNTHLVFHTSEKGSF